MKAVVLDGYTLTANDLSWDALSRLCDLNVYDSTRPEQIRERAINADIILTNKVVLKSNEFSFLQNCKYVGVLATGYNIVDLDEARRRSIVVTNIPSYSADSVAQLIFSFILNFTFHVADHSREVHEGKWCESKHFCYHSFPLQELNGKTLGIAGFGDIGSKVATIAEAFGMNVVFYNRSRKDVSSFKRIRQVEKDELFKASDFLSLCLPLNSETQNFVDGNSINMLKKSAYIVNTGRGGLVDESAIVNALSSGRIRGYATDVLSVEPCIKECPLLSSSAIITPHIAWQTYEARKRLMDIAVKNVEAFIAGSPINVVG